MGSAATVNPVLKVGAVAQTVQVEATAPMTDTTTTGVGQVVNSQSVVDLPLNGRQVTQLITLAGASNTVQYGFGGAPSVGNLVSSKNYPNEALVSVGGGMLNGTTYLMDGGTYNDPFNNLNLPTPFPDASPGIQRANQRASRRSTANTREARSTSPPNRAQRSFTATRSNSFATRISTPRISSA